MLLYHYSVDSYQGGGELINDFKNNCRFAEPFLLALDKGGDCFWSVYFAAMSYSRELCALGLRKHENYAKDAVEGIFEWVRRRDFSADVYYCESKDEAIAYLKADCLDNGDFSVDQVKLLEVEVDAARVFRYDQSFYNRAIDAMEQKRDLDAVIALAKAYFSKRRSEEPLIEILSDGKNRVIREIPVG